MIKEESENQLPVSPSAVVRMLINTSEALENSSFSEILKQLSTKENLKIPQRGTSEYKQLKHYIVDVLGYPNSSIARIHRKANKLGTLDLVDFTDGISENLTHEESAKTKIEDLNCCPCCGFRKQTKSLSTCSNDFYSVPNAGISTFFFFRVIDYLAVLSVFLLFLFAIYALITNIIASSQIKDSFPEKSSNVHIVALSIGSKIIASDQYKAEILIEIYLGLLTIIVFGVVFLAFRKFTEKATIHIMEHFRQVSDFSIVIQGVPADLTASELEEAFQEILKEEQLNPEILGQNPEDYKIAKINIARSVDIQKTVKKKIDISLRPLQAKEKKLRDKIISFVLELRSNPKFQTSIEKRNKYEKKYLQAIEQKQARGFQIAQQVTKEYQKIQNNVLTTAFVTFRTTKARNNIFKALENNLFYNFFEYLTFFLWSKKTEIKIRGQSLKVKIEEASEPEDIIWANIGVKDSTLIVRKLITFLLTLLILSASFALVLWLSMIRSQNENKIAVSIGISLVISLFNFLIIITLKIFTYRFEKNYSMTKTQTSIAIKGVIAQALNTIAIPVLVNRFIKDENFLFERSGLAQDIFVLSIAIAFSCPLAVTFDVYHWLMDKIMVKWIDRPEKKFYLNQLELNRHFELQNFEQGYEIVYPLNLFLFTCFYVSLQPIIVPITLLGLAYTYWSQKYSVFHRCKRPCPGTKIMFKVCMQIIYTGPFLYALGSLTFINILPEQIYDEQFDTSSYVGNIISIVVGVIIMSLPYPWLYGKLCKDNKEERQNLFYEKNRILFCSEYDRLNPATSEKAIDEFLQYIEELKSGAYSDEEQMMNNLSYLRQKSNINFNKNRNGMRLGGYLRASQDEEFYNALMNPQIQTFNPSAIHRKLSARPIKKNLQNTKQIRSSIQKSSSAPTAPNFNIKLGSSRIIETLSKTFGRKSDIKGEEVQDKIESSNQLNIRNHEDEKVESIDYNPSRLQKDEKLSNSSFQDLGWGTPHNPGYLSSIMYKKRVKEASQSTIHNKHLNESKKK